MQGDRRSRPQGVWRMICALAICGACVAIALASDCQTSHAQEGSSGPSLRVGQATGWKPANNAALPQMPTLQPPVPDNHTDGPEVSPITIQGKHGRTTQRFGKSVIVQAGAGSGDANDDPTKPQRPVNALAEDQWDPETAVPPNIIQVSDPPLMYSDGEPKYSPQGKGRIVIEPEHKDPCLPIFEGDDPYGILGRRRPNLFGQPVPDEWAFYNIINTDRPDFTDAPYTVGKGVTVIENGYTFRSIQDYEANTHLTRRTLPETLFRYGINDDLEIRLKWNGYIISHLNDRNTGNWGQGFGTDDLILGFKYEAIQQDEYRPMVTILGTTTVPTGTNGVSANQMQPGFNVVVGWGLRRWLYLKFSSGVDVVHGSSAILTTTNMGGPVISPSLMTFGNRDTFNLVHDSVSLIFQAAKHVGGFVECYGFQTSGAEDNRPAAYFDAGLFFYVTTNLQLDVRIGKRLSDRVDEVFTGAGLSVRF